MSDHLIVATLRLSANAMAAGDLAGALDALLVARGARSMLRHRHKDLVLRADFALTHKLIRAIQNLRAKADR